MSKEIIKDILEIMQYDEDEGIYSYVIKEFDEKYLCLIYVIAETTFYIELWNNYQDYTYGKFSIRREQATRYINEIIPKSEGTKWTKSH